MTLGKIADDDERDRHQTEDRSMPTADSGTLGNLLEFIKAGAGLTSPATNAPASSGGLSSG